MTNNFNRRRDTQRGVGGKIRRTLIEAILEINSMRQIDSNLYRVILSTHDSYEVIDATRQFSSSELVKDLLYADNEGEAAEDVEDRKEEKELP